MIRTTKEYLSLSLKGMAMGAADIIPGVSGGTIAFISGIYEELIETINNVNFEAIKKLKNNGIKSFWTHINGNFLIALLTGIAISIMSLAKVITHLLETHSQLLWGFFFGLIVASVYIVGKQVNKWDINNIISLIIGSSIAFYITILNPMQKPDALWFVFLSGSIAICAMILPGISGSFILLLLGSYEFILVAIKDFKLDVITIFGVGCITGLLAFSKLLNWLFKKYHDITIALLTGFLIGSLNKIWPWKETIQTRINSHGEIVPFIQSNVLPSNFEGDSNIIEVILLSLIGLVLIYLLERFSIHNNKI
jgi:putative membrane protein